MERLKETPLMVWSKCKAAALLAALVCAGMTCGGWVYSQQVGSQPLPGGVNASDVVVVNEPGKPPQHCVLQKTVRMPNGQSAVEVRNLATGEVTTLIMMDNVPSVSATADPKTKQAAGSWSATKNAPQPMPIIEEPASPSTGTAKFQPMPTGYAVKPAQTSTPAPAPTALYRTVDEPNKPPVKCRVMAEWKTPEGHKAAQLQSVESGEIMTMVEIAPVAGAANAKCTASLYHWGKSTTPPPGVPVPPLGAMTKTVGQPSQSFTPTDNVVVMPPGANVGANSGQKPSLGDYVKNAWNGMFSSRTPTTSQYSTPVSTFKTDAPKLVETTKIMDSPYASTVAKTNDTTNAVKTSNAPRGNDAVKTVDAPKSLDTAKPADAAKVIDNPKLAEAPKLLEMPKSFDPPKPIDVPKTNDGPKQSDMPKPPDTLKVQEAPKPLEAPKLPAVPAMPDAPKAIGSMPALPTSGGPDYKTQWSPVDQKAPGFGKPATDAPLPDVKPALPAAQATTSNVPSLLPLPPAPVSAQGGAPALPSNVPALPSVPAAATTTNLPLTPAPVASSNSAPTLPTLPASQTTLPAVPAPVAPAQTNMLPALPPTAAAPTIGAGKRSDPLDNPEMLLPKRAEDKMPAVAGKSAIGMAQATDSPRFAPGAGSVAAAANASDARYLPMTLPQAKPASGQPPMTPETVDAVGFSNAFTPPQTQQPQQPTVPQGNPAIMTQGNGSMAMTYRGPMPPNPMMAAQGYPMPMMPQAYAMPMTPLVPYANAAMDRPGMVVNANMSTQQFTSILQSSIYPSERESAVYQLSNCDWSSNPQVVQLLLTAAKEDPAPMVRAAAVGSLGRMGVATEAVQATCNQLKTDADPRVRQEAEQTLIRCGASNTGSGIQTVGGR